MKLFSGLHRAFGQYDLSDTAEQEGGKRKGKAQTMRADVMPEHYRKHLLGEKPDDAIGIIPIQDDNSVEFGAIDVDEYLKPKQAQETDEDFEARKKEFEREFYGRIITIIRDNNLPVNPCRSKSGGVHLFVFCDRPMPASMVKRKLEDLAAQIGYPESEVFPKQNNISKDGVGNWINLPFFRHEDTDRYGWDVSTGEPIMDLVQWLSYAESRKLTPQHFNTIAVKQLPPGEAEGASFARVLSDGPPCLQKLLERGIPEGKRNIVAYNVGVYLHKKHGSDDPAITDEMIEIQQKHFNPALPDHEVQYVLNNVAQAEQKRYQCQTQPLLGNCNRTLCMRRTYGAHDNDFTYDFGTLWHVIPVSKTSGRELWEESNYRLQFTLNDEDHEFEISPEDLLKFNTIRTQALYRGVMIPHMDAEDWHDLIREKMRNKQRDMIPEEVTAIGELRLLIEDFFEMYANATEKRLISTVKAWHNIDEGEYWVLPSTIPAFLKRRRFTALSGNRLLTTLKTHFGMTQGKRRIKEDSSGTSRIWLFPDTLTPNEHTADPDDENLDGG